MQERYQREGWLLDAAAIYCGAVRSLAGHLASAQIGSPYRANVTRGIFTHFIREEGEDLYYRLGGWLEETEPLPAGGEEHVPGDAAPATFELAEATPTSTGTLIATYRPA
jgi:hypothetical protein